MPEGALLSAKSDADFMQDGSLISSFRDHQVSGPELVYVEKEKE